MSNVHTNFYPVEGTLVGTTEVVFPWKPKTLTIINDSGSTELLFRLHPSYDWATLRPKETVQLENVSNRSLHLQAVTDVDYRVWGIG